MEYLDVYDESHQLIGTKSRAEVHETGLWHNTVHCWLYDKLGNVYFQIRQDEHKLYTTSSGHVDAGESVEEAVTREVKEEIGIDASRDKLESIGIVKWQSSSMKKGKPFIDNAFANVFLLPITLDDCHFVFQEEEVLGLAKMRASDVLSLLRRKVDSISAIMIYSNNEEKEQVVYEDDFLMDTDVFMEKYSFVLEKIQEKVK